MTTPATLHRACPVCGGTTYRYRVTVRGTPIFTCDTCQLATWNWSAFDPTAFYDDTYWHSAEVGKGYADYFSLAEALAQTNRKRLTHIRRLLAGDDAAPRRPRLLDAGCGPGMFVAAASAAGFDAAGVEVSAYAVESARARGLNVWQGQVRTADLRSTQDAAAELRVQNDVAADLPVGRRPSRSSAATFPYDVVTLWDVIEHLPDPAAALADVATVLRPGGVVVLSTGDIDTFVGRLSGPRWHLFNLPEHLWFFTAGSLRRLLRRVGLEPVDTRYEVCWYPVRYLVERLEAMFGRARTVSKGLGKLGALAVPVTLADVVTVSARKPLHHARARVRGMAACQAAYAQENASRRPCHGERDERVGG